MTEQLAGAKISVDKLQITTTLVSTVHSTCSSFSVFIGKYIEYLAHKYFHDLGNYGYFSTVFAAA